MFCKSCGSNNGDDGNFCKQCGLRLEKPAHSKISVQDFERAMPEDEQITSLLERAYRARKDGDRAGAIALCHEGLALRPNSTSCHSLLGQLYEQGGERDLAIEQYERVLALNPGSIADRVKLDELRGDVPSIMSDKRSQPHIVLADRTKDYNPLDYRIPAFALAGVALMVLGGIFTMQMLSHNGTDQRSSVDTSHSSAVGIQPGVAQTGQGAGQKAAAGQNQSSDPAPYPYNSLAGLGQPPIIIQTPAAQPAREYPTPGNGAGPARLTANSPGQDAGTTNTASDDNKDIGTGKVRISTGDKDTFTDTPDPAASTTPNKNDRITIHQSTGGSQESAAAGNSGATDPSTGSSTHKNEAMADLLAQQGQYKQAGDAYLRALNGAGDETAYIYRRAAWCFEKAGEKTTAVSYYQQGIDAAKQLVSAGREPEIAKNLIRECQTGIRACTN